MRRKQNSIDFEIPHQQITRNRTEQLAADNPRARTVAQPVFNAGIAAIGLARKKAYDSGPQKCRQNDFFMLLLQGELAVKLGSQTFTQQPRTLLFCPKTVPFARANKSASSWWIYFELADDESWKPLRQHGSYMREYESTDHVLLLVSRILEARRNPAVLSRLDALENARTLTGLLKRELRIMVDARPQARAEALQDLVERINKRPEKKWSVSKMAKEVGVSSRTLSRLFRREYGMGPMDLVIQKRIDAATEMLAATDDIIEEIARKLNYKSVYSFSSLFKRHLGVRPGQFRQQCRAEKSKSHSK